MSNGKYQDLVIPRGRVYLAEQRDDGSFGPELFMGDCPEVTLSTAIETAEARDSGSPTSRLLKRIVTSVDRTIAITAREMLAKNLARFVGGTVETVTQDADTVAGEALDSEPVEAGSYYQLGADDENPTGVRSVSNVALKTGVTTYTQGTDYLVDSELGRIYIPEGSACVGALVTADYSVAAATWEQIASVDSSISRRGRLRIISDNVGGRSRDFVFPLVEIQPEGDLSFTSESDWQSVGFTVTVLTPEDAAGNPLPSVYVDNRPLAVSGS